MATTYTTLTNVYHSLAGHFHKISLALHIQAWKKQFYGGMANFMMAINCVGGTVTKFNDTVISNAFIYTHYL